MRNSPVAVLILAFGLSTAALYATLLPLWEGFDEAFHYGYVQHLAAGGGLPRLGVTSISREVRRSLALAPVSPVVRREIPGTKITFPEWFALPPNVRAAARRELELMNRDAGASVEYKNYEAHQAPLAYLMLAPVERAASGMTLLHRALILRLCAAIASTLLLFAAGKWLCGALCLTGTWQWLALACVFETQMLWATVGHVGNDWLAVPLATALFAALVRSDGKTSGKFAIASMALLGAGLLTKAYFLAFLPVSLGVLAWELYRRRIPLANAAVAVLIPVAAAGPWYLRNWLVAGSISGTQESVGGVGLRQVFEAAGKVNWLEAAADMARGSLWTGNNSFTTFSRTTLNLELLLLFAGLALALYHRRFPARLLSAFLVYAAALGYATCVSFSYTHGAAKSASPWYADVLLAPAIIVMFAGFQRSGVAGRALAALFAAVAGWVCVATYVVKLFPLYGGLGGSPGRVATILPWWLRDGAARDADLASVALGPVWVLYLFLALVIAGAAVITVLLLWSLRGKRA